ncbi:MAG: acetyltransferase [Planctomycetes bacterium]|nr:acetyltransferase [Planctomycetota bacterium]
MNLPVLIVGGGGHARVLIDCLRLLGATVIGVLDRNPALVGRELSGAPILGDEESIAAHRPGEVALVNGLGWTGGGAPRAALFTAYRALAYRFRSVIHPSAVVARDATLGEGVQIMAGAIVQTGCAIGDNALIYTRASIEHDCVIGEHAYVGPGVTLTSSVRVGARTLLDTGAVVALGVAIGSGCTVPVGGIVRRDLADGATLESSHATKD